MKEEIEQIKKALFRISGYCMITKEIAEILNPPNPKEFLECDTCRVKTGSPELCKGCLHNRALIEKLTK